MEKDYNNYEALDFLNDASFLEWLRNEKEESVAFWENWIRDHPEKSAAVNSAKEYYELLTSFEEIKPGPGEYEEVWKGIKKGIDEQARLKIHRVKMFRWAAGVAAVLLFIGGWFTYKQMQLPKEKFVIIKAENGKKKIMLADSSMVVLNTNAVLKYHPGHCRELWLKGQAFFDVKHRNNAFPFEVHAGKNDITVLGTTFTVKTVSDAARVILLKGKVKTSVGSQYVILKPGDKVEWQNGKFVTKQINPKLYLAWKTGEFHFDHTSLKELKELIKDYYGYDLIVKNKTGLKTKTISGTVPARNEEVLWKTLALMFHAKVKKEGKQIILTVK